MLGVLLLAACKVRTCVRVKYMGQISPRAAGTCKVREIFAPAVRFRSSTGARRCARQVECCIV